MTKLAAVTASVLLTTTAFAQQDSQKSLDYSLDTGNVEITPAGETSTIQKDEVEDDEPFLPIFGKEAREKGYELPKSYGVNVNYMNIHQNINVKSIQFDGLTIPFINRPLKPDLFKIRPLFMFLPYEYELYEHQGILNIENNLQDLEKFFLEISRFLLPI